MKGKFKEANSIEKRVREGELMRKHHPNRVPV
jgi:hypothetical protein